MSTESSKFKKNYSEQLADNIGKFGYLSQLVIFKFKSNLSYDLPVSWYRNSPHENLSKRI